MLTSIDKIGDWNPQLLRELKGRLKPFPVIIAFVTSLATQLVIFLYQLREFPSNPENESEITIDLRYCEATNIVKEQYARWVSCPTNQIDMQLWWQDHWKYMFFTLCVIFIFTLLVAGSYLIINDLSQEERKGTLNFIRLSPQSETTIFTGKMLGVPVLIYLLVLAAIPFHILTGINGNLPFGNILCFYLILVASCILFYSLACLFGIFGGSVLSGFKPWLGSGLVLLFLWVSMQFTSHESYNSYGAFARLFSPTDITHYFFPDCFSYRTPALQKLQFFNFAIGKSFISVIALHLLNYALWTYWAWQGLKRCFRNPNATIISKQQSYLIFACFEVVLIGFFIPEDYSNPEYSTDWDQLNTIMGTLYAWNMLIIVPLFALILTHRQAIQDWARFRFNKEENSVGYSKNSLFSELIFGEKSPAILAMAINLLIVTSAFIVLFLKASVDISYTSDNVLRFVSSLLLFVSLIMIYATVAQIMLMLKNSKRTLWAAGTTSALIIVPTIILGALSAQQSNILWLFTVAFWFATEKATFPIILSAFLCQVVIVGLLNYYLIKQVKYAGESASKAMFSQAKV
ncbi:MAG: ABC transporter permease [Rivularia sp. (in: cyanobacteria)]